MELQIYTNSHIESFLLNYRIFISDLAEVAQDWSALDQEERSQHHADFLQTWSNRKVLGALFKASKLTSAQETQLAGLDRQLLAQTALMERCFSLSLHQLLAIFRWGTPVSQSVQPLYIEIEPASLERLAATPVFA